MMTTTAPEAEIPRTAIPRINDPAPQFTTLNTTSGPFSLKDLKDKWVLLFSHPADFTPVCTTEFVAFAKDYQEFRTRNVEIVGLSVDSIYAHLAWLRNIESTFGVKIPFRVIADRDMKLASLYGMIQPNESETSTVRAAFFISPEGKQPNGQLAPQRIRAIVYYPMTVGRNTAEILRVFDALQLEARHQGQVATPCNWKPGEPVIVPPPSTQEAAEARKAEVAKEKGDYKDWYFSTKHQPLEAKTAR
jgi:peroxiredoxin (alkyl hydroperoxide reductase subunit C)